MFTFSEDEKELCTAIKVCAQRGLYDAVDELEEDLTKLRFSELFMTFPELGRILGDAVSDGELSKDDTPCDVKILEKGKYYEGVSEAYIDFTYSFIIVINLETGEMAVGDEFDFDL